ncbi:predicted protein, partial [Nematostella vectensis]
STFTGHIEQNLADAIVQLQSHTCLKFVHYSGQANFIHITNTNGCSSKIGKMYYQTGPQTLSLGSGCNQVGVILHELLHAVGFWHEQSRSDRDKYVRINWENILDGFADQFDKYGSQTIDDIGMDYDYKSIMHYSRKAFTKNGNPTIEAIHDPNMEFSNGNILSPKDIIEINALYDCKSKYQCGKRACADSDATQCPLWAKAGECPKNAAWMKANCGKSCGFC